MTARSPRSQEPTTSALNVRRIRVRPAATPGGAVFERPAAASTVPRRSAWHPWLPCDVLFDVLSLFVLEAIHPAGRALLKPAQSAGSTGERDRRRRKTELRPSASAIPSGAGDHFTTWVPAMRTLGAERAADKRADQEPACKPNPLQEPRWSEPVPNLGCPVRPVRWRFSDSYPNGTHLAVGWAASFAGVGDQSTADPRVLFTRLLLLLGTEVPEVCGQLLI